jgi:RsiW-degrading membrane proteinase PrsW (M82 family)
MNETPINAESLNSHLIGAVAIPLAVVLLYRQLIHPPISWRLTIGLFVLAGVLVDVCTAMLLQILFLACPTESATLQFYPHEVMSEQAEPTLYSSFHDALFLAALPEQGSRFIILLLTIWLFGQFNCRANGVFFGAIIALGFASAENLGSYLAHSLELGRIVAVLSHSFSGAILGYFVGRALVTLATRRLRVLVTGLLTVTTLHFLYDFGLFLTDAIANWESSPEDWRPSTQVAVLSLLLAPYLIWVSELVATCWIIRQCQSFVDRKASCRGPACSGLNIRK